MVHTVTERREMQQTHRDRERKEKTDRKGKGGELIKCPLEGPRSQKAKGRDSLALKVSGHGGTCMSGESLGLTPKIKEP